MAMMDYIACSRCQTKYATNTVNLCGLFWTFDTNKPLCYQCVDVSKIGKTCFTFETIIKSTANDYLSLITRCMRVEKPLTAPTTARFPRSAYIAPTPSPFALQRCVSAEITRLEADEAMLAHKIKAYYRALECRAKQRPYLRALGISQETFNVVDVELMKGVVDAERCKDVTRKKRHRLECDRRKDNAFGLSYKALYSSYEEDLSDFSLNNSTPSFAGDY